MTKNHRSQSQIDFGACSTVDSGLVRPRANHLAGLSVAKGPTELEIAAIQLTLKSHGPLLVIEGENNL